MCVSMRVQRKWQLKCRLKICNTIQNISIMLFLCTCVYAYKKNCNHKKFNHTEKHFIMIYARNDFGAFRNGYGNRITRAEE